MNSFKTAKLIISILDNLIVDQVVVNYFIKSGSCCFYPYGWEVMLVWVWKTQFCGSFSFNFLSSRKHSRVDMSYFFDYFFSLQMWFQIFFNWWHSPLAWWHSQELKFKKSFEINNQFDFSLPSFEVRISIISSLFIFNKFLSRTSWDPANYNNFELRLVSSMPQTLGPTAYAIMNNRKSVLSLIYSFYT